MRHYYLEQVTSSLPPSSAATTTPRTVMRPLAKGVSCFWSPLYPDEDDEFAPGDLGLLLSTTAASKAPVPCTFFHLILILCYSFFT